MDPASMQAAMEAFKNMPPDQMQRMMASMGNISPEMMTQAQTMASRMSPDDWARARQQFSSLSPDELEGQASQAQAHFSAQQKYVLTASQQLKNEGNQLHTSGKYAEAIEKYQRAKDNVSSHSSTEAADLRKACSLNLSSCYLQLKEWRTCMVYCNEVLAVDASNLKALYRRGQAHMGVQDWSQAVDDLSRAVKLVSNDPDQLRLIKEKLQDAKDQLSIQRASGQLPEPVPAPEAPPAPAAAAAPAAPATQPSTISSSSSGMPAVDPAVLKAAADQMRTNPDFMKQTERMIQNMSDEQLQQLSRTTGVNVTRSQLASDWANNLTPEQLEKFAKVQEFQQQLQSSGVAAQLQSNPSDPEALAATTRMMQDNPDMLNTMVDMLSAADPAQLASMAAQAGVPAASLTPDFIKTAASTLKNMKPEDLQAMTQMAASMRPPGSGASAVPATTTSTTSTASRAATGSNGSSAVPASLPASSSTPSSGSSALAGAVPPGGMPQMTPEMAKMAADMMSSMSPEQLQAMTQSMSQAGGSGAAGMPTITPEMAKMAADMMSKISPEELQRMTSMFGSGMPGGAPGMMPGMAGPGGMPDASMLGRMDPQAMKSAMNMMRNMEPEAMRSMLMQTGMCKSEAQADAMVSQMKNMSDKQMDMMLKAANVVQSAAQAMRKTKEAVASRSVLFIGLAVLLLAILLRWLGIM